MEIFKTGDLLTAANLNRVLCDVSELVGDLNSVKAYGAIGDGVTDDTAAIQYAIDFLATSTAPNNGAILYFPTGIYQHTGLIMSSRVILMGDGIGATVFSLIGGSNVSSIAIPLGASMFGLRDLTVDGNKTGNPVVQEGLGALSFDATATNQGGSSALMNGKPTQSAYSYKYAALKNVAFVNSSNDGIYIESYNYIIDGQNVICSYNNGNGILDKGTDHVMDNVLCEKNGLSGLKVYGGANKYTNVKAIWNGRIDATPGTVANIFCNGKGNIVTGEAQDGYCDGIYINARHSIFNIIGNQNGYAGLGNEGTSSRIHANLRIGASAEKNSIDFKSFTYKGEVGDDGYWTTEYPYVIDQNATFSRFNCDYDPATCNSKPPYALNVFGDSPIGSIKTYSNNGIDTLSDIDIKLLTPASGDATLRIFRNNDVGSTGAAKVVMHTPGSSLVQNSFDAKGNTQVNKQIGNLVVGDTTLGGAWDTAHLQLGNDHLWMDTTGSLRTKTSAPTSAIDGKLIGVDVRPAFIPAPINAFLGAKYKTLKNESAGEVVASETTTGGTSGVYAPGDTITMAGGTFTTAAILKVRTTKLLAATITAAGTGGTDGTNKTLTGTTGTGDKFVVYCTVAGGIVTAITSIKAYGKYTANPTTPSAEPCTSNAGVTGCTLNIEMSVFDSFVINNGKYQVRPENPVSQSSTTGSGVGATFTLSFTDMNPIVAMKYSDSSGAGATSMIASGVYNDFAAGDFYAYDSAAWTLKGTVSSKNYYVPRDSNAYAGLNQAVVGFHYDGQVFELQDTHDSQWQFLVDNGEGFELLQPRYIKIPLISSHFPAVLSIDFGSRQVRRIICIGQTFGLGGINTEPTARISPFDFTKYIPAWGLITDSFGRRRSDAFFGGPFQEAIVRFGGVIGFQSSEDSSGYTQGGPTTPHLFVERLPALIAASPSFTMTAGALNDAILTFPAKVLEYYTTLFAGLPTAWHYIIGCWTPASARNAGELALCKTRSDNILTALQTFTAIKWVFIDPANGMWTRSDGTFGMIGAPEWMTGTGHEGGTAGDGNSDYYINSGDFTHLNIVGNIAIGDMILKCLIDSNNALLN